MTALATVACFALPLGAALVVRGGTGGLRLWAYRWWAVAYAAEQARAAYRAQMAVAREHLEGRE